jgi:hypothetical protein
MAPLNAAIHSGGGGPCLRSRGIGESTARSGVLGVRTGSRGSALGRWATYAEIIKIINGAQDIENYVGGLGKSMFMQILYLYTIIDNGTKTIQHKRSCFSQSSAGSLTEAVNSSVS